MEPLLHQIPEYMGDTSPEAMVVTKILGTPRGRARKPGATIEEPLDPPKAIIPLMSGRFDT